MEALFPTPITDSVVVSTVPSAEDSTSAWVSGQPYAAGALVHRVQTHRVYEAAAGGVTSTTPPENDPTHWSDQRATNRWAMFDDQASSTTEAANSLTAVLAPGFMNTLWLGNLEGAVLHFVAEDAPGGTVLRDELISLEDDPPADYYEWCFARWRPRRDVLITDLAPYLTMQITLEITGPSTVKCGMVQIGMFRDLGTTLAGAQAKPVTWSYIGLDEFGNNTIKRRKHSRDMSAQAICTLEQANEVLDAIDELLDVPCLVVGHRGTRYRGLRCYGLISATLSFDDDDPVFCLLDIDMKGLI